MICLKLGSWLASQKADKNVQLHCRSPHGERGLKYDVADERAVHDESLSSWRAWIEISVSSMVRMEPCRSPHGERGLKFT